MLLVAACAPLRRLVGLPEQEHDHQLTADVGELEQDEVHDVPVVMVPILVHVIGQVEVARDEPE